MRKLLFQAMYWGSVLYSAISVLFLFSAIQIGYLFITARIPSDAELRFMQYGLAVGAIILVGSALGFVEIMVRWRLRYPANSSEQHVLVNYFILCCLFVFATTMFAQAVNRELHPGLFDAITPGVALGIMVGTTSRLITWAIKNRHRI